MPPHVLCEKRLQRWYRNYNARWFAGRLPTDVDVIYAPHIGCSGQVSREDHVEAKFLIQIHPALALDKKVVRMTLLHEMAHMAVWPYMLHGKKFQDEMLRLAKAGAFAPLW